MNYFIIRSKQDRAVLGITSKPTRAEDLATSWRDFFNNDTEVEILPCPMAVAVLGPRERVFHVFSTDEGITVRDGIQGELRYINDTTSLPKGREFGVPHIEELSNGRFIVDLYVHGDTYFDNSELIDDSERIIENAILSFIKNAIVQDIGQPDEQRFTTDDAVFLWMITQGAGVVFTVGELIDRMEQTFGFVATEAFPAIMKLVDEDKLTMNCNTVSLKTHTPANVVQDQSSSFDGEVIL